jgi:hypothetical protein
MHKPQKLYLEADLSSFLPACTPSTDLRSQRGITIYKIGLLPVTPSPCRHPPESGHQHIITQLTTI